MTAVRCSRRPTTSRWRSICGFRFRFSSCQPSLARPAADLCPARTLFHCRCCGSAAPFQSVSGAGGVTCARIAAIGS
jgi:hypothetical protein